MKPNFKKIEPYFLGKCSPDAENRHIDKFSPTL